MIRRAVVWALVAATLLVLVASGGCGANADGPPLVGTYEASVSVTGDGSAACSTAPPPPPQDPSKLPSCCTTGAAHCIPKDQVVPSLASQLASCSGGYCEPDPIIQNPAFVPAKCTAFNGTPGACISLCVPQVQQYLSVLKQGTCAADERCAPCINPLDNSNTGACDVGNNQCGGDSGASEGGGGVMCPYTGPPKLDPTSFPQCTPSCAGSHCVPAALVPAAQQSQLAKCPSAADSGLDGYCVPDPFIESGGEGLPATCTSVAGSEGRCLSACIPMVAGEANVLPQATCAATERCAPCFNPTASDPTAPTGACAIACDKPAKPPVVLTCPWNGPKVVDPSVFPACSPACSGAHCVPSSLVPPSQQSQLAACPGGFCTPDPIAASDNHYVPTSCTPFPDPASEGRCTSDCLPAVQQQSGQLVQAGCPSGDLCAPCTDPFKGTSTGACTLACDMPKKPPFTFPLCCNYQGQNQATCVPKSLVPSGQQASLKQDVCPTNQANYLCVPDEYLPNSTTPVATCTDPLLGKGACVSRCANLPVTTVILTQQTCPSNHICVPCSLAPAGTPGC